jgi:hypothetical protein
MNLINKDLLEIFLDSKKIKLSQEINILTYMNPIILETPLHRVLNQSYYLSDPVGCMCFVCELCGDCMLIYFPDD